MFTRFMIERPDATDATPTDNQPPGRTRGPRRGTWTPARKVEFMRLMPELEPYRVPKGQVREQWDAMLVTVNLKDSAHHSAMNKKKALFNFDQRAITSQSGTNHFADDLKEATYHAYVKFTKWTTSIPSVRSASRQDHPHRQEHITEMRQAAMEGMEGRGDASVDDGQQGRSHDEGNPPHDSRLDDSALDNAIVSVLDLLRRQQQDRAEEMALRRLELEERAQDRELKRRFVEAFETLIESFVSGKPSGSNN
ncbi:unnamed protein product [Absidia cylindrospora]